MTTDPLKHKALTQFMLAAAPGVAVAAAVGLGMPVAVAGLFAVGGLAVGISVASAARLAHQARMASSALATVAGFGGAGAGGVGTFLVLTNPVGGIGFMAGMALCAVSIPVGAILGTYYAGRAAGQMDASRLNPIFNATVAGVVLGAGLSVAAALHQTAPLTPSETMAQPASTPQAMLQHKAGRAAPAFHHS